VYAATRAGMFSPAVRDDRALVYASPPMAVGLWLSGRRSTEVYVFGTGGTGGTGGDNPSQGRLLTRIPVGREPYGLVVWPLPGRFSLGHTGILR